ncbi:MAG: polysaccharide deacetylase family protein [Chitinophagaceae bacterium]|nr:polysaccharide deacetylase family protein [Chitinophagaceae bacterium]
MIQLLLYTPQSSARLHYIFGVLCNAIGISSYQITHRQQEFNSFTGAKINYSADIFDEGLIQITPGKLLFEDTLTEQDIECFEWKNTKAFFETGRGEMPFDLFAASFYLLTRYEEYLPHEKDFYGRFAHTKSLAFKEDFLHLPLVNLWFRECALLLQKKYESLQLVPPVFTYVPTYDIDMAWSYFNKGFVRNTAGLLRSVIDRNLQSIIERLGVLLVFEDDPFDIYEWLDTVHDQHALQPVYFFLVAAKPGKYDKNISPKSRYFQLLISKLSVMYTTGLHPSWQSGDNTEMLQQELRYLQTTSGKKIKSSRQHYIRMSLPGTYQQLIKAGINKDFSMGYGSINGFRASYCMPYPWYDLSAEQQTDLTVYPFCYMEANSLFEQKFSPEQALNEMEQYCAITKQLNGTFITIFHNHLLTEQPLQIAWRNMYQQFLERNF